MQLAQFISPCHTGWPDMILSMSYRSANALGPNHSPVPYRLAGSDTYLCHTGWPDTILSVSYRSANAVGPNHCSVPYRLAGSDPYPCHTGRPMHLAQIIALCHTGWPDLIPIYVIQFCLFFWHKSFLCVLQVGRI